MGCDWNLIVIPAFMYFAVIVSSQDINITVPLNKTLIFGNKELFGDFYTLNTSSTLKINFVDVDEDLAFIVVQAHSYIHNITLYQNVERLNGTNVGLVSFTMSKLAPYYVLNPNENVSVLVYISVHGYDITDPIPGGCNMELPLNVSAFLRVTSTDNYIMVDAGSPRLPGFSCQYLPTTEFYMMYLPEMNFDADAYFKGIRSMMTYEGITENGVLLPAVSDYWGMRRMLSAYPGSGAVYAVVASNGPHYAVYVPAHSYACQVDGDDCQHTVEPFSDVMYAVLLFAGLFLCYFGHRFFKTEMFLAGFFTGVIITYILIRILKADIDTSVLVCACVLSGACFGCVWLLFWWLYCIPVFAVMLPTLLLGFMLASIFYYRLPAVPTFIRDDTTFWVLFVTVILLTSLVLVSATLAGNVLACAALGAYAAVFSLDHYLGANLRYIVLNVVRRATVENFYRVLTVPPFQWRDAVVTFTWVMLAVSGLLFQHYHNSGRPPFPPPPRAARLHPPPPTYGAVPSRRTRPQAGRNTTPSERTALLA